ncbi:TIGR03089 family protein [Aestuariimicrobium soli]|uniref:TIGR03089 family protein n=1 Tax=Aestuariimicrobium soli TaxID=2035834 RepID=UPI003EBE98AF
MLTALENRVQRDGARPLLTWYEPATGARVELSATTFANWVDKTRNLCDTLGVDDEAVVALPVVHDHPGHWLAWVWVVATWQAGGRAVVGPREGVEGADLVVVGPEDVSPVPGVETVACSLHPLGLGLSVPAPGVTDAHEILSEPDVHVPGSPTDLWWSDAAGDLDGAALAGMAPISTRLLVRGDDPRQVLTALVGVVLGGGSLVLVDGPASDEQVAAIAAAELTA